MFGTFLVLVDDLSLEKCSGFFPIFNMGVLLLLLLLFVCLFLSLSCRSSLYICFYFNLYQIYGLKIFPPNL